MPPAPSPLIRTERLVLRRWRPSDLEPFAAINADPEVMRFFPATRTRAETEELVARAERGFEERGYGLWAVDRLDRVDRVGTGGGDGHGREPGRLIGFVGLAPMHPGSPGAGGVEVGWRLGRFAWGHGFATEAARATLADGISRLGLDEVWSWTAVLNVSSQAVMRRLGMHEHARSLHPDLPPDHPLAPHVTYRLGAADWAG